MGVLTSRAALPRKASAFAIAWLRASPESSVRRPKRTIRASAGGACTVACNRMRKRACGRPLRVLPPLVRGRALYLTSTRPLPQETSTTVATRVAYLACRDDRLEGGDLA